MQYSRLGHSGLIVSRLAFGAMTFTAGNRANAALFKVDLDGAGRLVSMARDAGINFFDTADVYAGGESEEMLGQLLKPYRDDVIIATKVGGRNGAGLQDAGLSRRHIMASVDRSLRRLGTDWIDVYIVHRFDPLTPIEETMRALDDVVRAGKVRYLGFSNWPAWGVAAAMEIARSGGLSAFTHGQMYYSLMGRDIESEYLPMAARYGLGTTVWSPLAGGFLSGKYRRDMTPADGRLTSFDQMPMDRERGYAILDTLDAIAAARGATVAAVALAWLLAQPQVTSVLVGASSEAQLTANIAASELTLNDDEIERIEAISRTASPYPAWFLERFGDPKVAAALAR